MADSKTKSIVLSSRHEELQRIEPFVDELQEWAGFNDDRYGNIMLALSEAATNAIVHGNKKDASKQVRIEARRQSGRLAISIKDQGDGFDPSTLPDPLQDENLLSQGGRGVYLIEQYADEVTYSDGGTKITLEFNLK